MDDKFDPNIPIYLQIMDEIKHQIVTGKLLPGNKIDSVREMAVHYGANPNTIQRALQELERDGLLYTERTMGRFLVDDAEQIQRLKIELSSKVIQEFITKMTQLGFSGEEMLKAVQEYNQ